MIVVRDATADRWDDVVTVMSTRGDPAGCWCQYFRLRGRDWQAATLTDNRTALRAQVRHDPVPPGVLAYDETPGASWAPRDRPAVGRSPVGRSPVGRSPVGWCAVAPRRAYPRLAHAAVPDATADEEGLWSLTCFVVRVGHRRRGVAGALLDGAVDLARRHGARVVEAYPVDLAVKKATSAELYHGTLSLFLRAGFTEVARPRPHRPVVRRPL